MWKHLARKRVLFPLELMRHFSESLFPICRFSVAALFTSANAVARKESSIQSIKSLVSHRFLAFVRSVRFTMAAATKNRRELRNVSLREIPVSRCRNFLRMSQ